MCDNMSISNYFLSHLLIPPLELVFLLSQSFFYAPVNIKQYAVFTIRNPLVVKMNAPVVNYFTLHTHTSTQGVTQTVTFTQAHAQCRRGRAKRLWKESIIQPTEIFGVQIKTTSKNKLTCSLRSEQGLNDFLFLLTFNLNIGHTIFNTIFEVCIQNSSLGQIRVWATLRYFFCSFTPFAY